MNDKTKLIMALNIYPKIIHVRHPIIFEKDTAPCGVYKFTCLFMGRDDALYENCFTNAKHWWGFKLKELQGYIYKGYVEIL